MKKRLLKTFSIITLIILILTFNGCNTAGGNGGAVSETQYFNVTFNSNGGSEIESLTVESGQKIDPPADPEKQNFSFNGWYNGSALWRFNTDVVKEDLTLSASWSLENITEFDKNILTGAQIYEKVAPSMVSVISFKDSVKQGEGSGFIISQDGYIVTNAHVIEDAEHLEVYINNQNDTKYISDEFWCDFHTDIGIIKIEANNLITAEIGIADNVKIGEDVYAIGNPGGIEFKYSITKGIISYKYRQYSPLKNDDYLVDVFQVDATINPGNSGGALVNMYGQVIGINSAKIVATGYEGLGFSISIDDALPVINALLSSDRSVLRPALGITYDPSTIASGITIVSVNKNSDLYGKLQEGDIITKINNIKINSTDSIKAALNGKKAGQTISLRYKRGNAQKEISFILMDATLLYRLNI